MFLKHSHSLHPLQQGDFSSLTEFPNFPLNPPLRAHFSVFLENILIPGTRLLTKSLLTIDAFGVVIRQNASCILVHIPQQMMHFSLSRLRLIFALIINARPTTIQPNQLGHSKDVFIIIVFSHF